LHFALAALKVEKGGFERWTKSALRRRCSIIRYCSSSTRKGTEGFNGLGPLRVGLPTARQLVKGAKRQVNGKEVSGWFAQSNFGSAPVGV